MPLAAYDVVYDQVVLPQPTSPLTLRLINERVRYFFIGGHHFIRLVADSAAGNVIRTGYYEALVDSSVQVLARRAKTFLQQVNHQQIDAVFTEKDKLFVRKEGRYYLVAKKAAVLRLFADRAPEMQRYAQDQRLSFGKARFEASVVALARYYNRLPTR